jgi:hypothetical protein
MSHFYFSLGNYIMNLNIIYYYLIIIMHKYIYLLTLYLITYLTHYLQSKVRRIYSFSFENAS